MATKRKTLSNHAGAAGTSLQPNEQMVFLPSSIVPSSPGFHSSMWFTLSQHARRSLPPLAIFPILPGGRGLRLVRALGWGHAYFGKMNSPKLNFRFTEFSEVRLAPVQHL